MISRGRESRVAVTVWLTVILLAGCSGIKPYPDAPKKNVHVHTTVEPGSWFSSVHAAVDIHRVGTDCKTEYEGTMQLNRPFVELGIPSERRSQLVFVFASSSFWSNRSGTMAHETLVKPRAGYQYRVDVTYRDDIYNVVIRELEPNKSASREIERRGIRDCSSR